jgi:para-nitrobenzyl esterase
MELYPAANDAEAATAANSWQTDSWFACPSRFIADRMGRDSSNTFFFVFTRSLQAPGGDQLGTVVGAEVPYAFDNLGLEPWVPRNAHDRQLAHIMADYWVRFATTGDPNGDGLPSWPVYNSRSRGHLELGDTIAARTGIRPDRCALYDELQALRITGGNQP